VRVTSRPRAILFDLDGTLVDSRADIAVAANHALRAAGRAPLSTETLAGFVGDGARALLARAFGVPPDAPELAQHVERWRTCYLANPVAHTTWMPGAREAIDALRARSIAIAVVTNKDRVVTSAILRALGVEDRVDAVWGGDDGPLKPAPDGPIAMMRALGVAPGETWMVGDGPQDIGAARAAGCPSVALLGGFTAEARLREAGPDVVIASMAELVALVEHGLPGRAGAAG
jgi:phosphoglycolate phosphatase